MKQRPVEWVVVALVLAPGGFGSAGCATRWAASTPLYSGVIRSAAGVPGQPGKFRLRLRLRRVDGRPLTPIEHPDIEIVHPALLGGAPGPSYTMRMVRLPGQTSFDLAIHGQLSRPTTGPVTLVVNLFATRPVPLWKRLFGLMPPSYEITSRFPLGTFILPAGSPSSPASAKKRPGSSRGAALNVWE